MIKRGTNRAIHPPTATAYLSTAELCDMVA